MLNKFESIYQMIKESINYNNVANIDDELDDNILDFVETPIGKQYQKRINAAFNNTLSQFKVKYPKYFDNTKLYFEMLKTDVDLFAELDEQLNIHINMYPIFEDLYYHNLTKDKNTDILDDILDDWEYNKCVIAHELAHIIDMKNLGIHDFYSYNQAHSNTFKKIFKDITKKCFNI